MSGIELKAGVRASELLYEVLGQARSKYETVFSGLRWPKTASAFRGAYAPSLIAFERRRVASEARAEIAKLLVEASSAAMRYRIADNQDVLLEEYLAQTAEPLKTETVKLNQRPGLVPELHFQGKHYRGEDVAHLVDEWLGQRWMTESAHRGIRWTLDSARDAGKTELVGHKIVSLGAGAELSPTRAMLRAGADVLFIDARDPSAELLKDSRVSGQVTFVPGGANLLTQPREIAATIRKFAGSDPLHIGMYAYSGGAAQEWRLTTAMNAIIRSLPPDLVRSIVLLISPTTPGTVSTVDATAANERGQRWHLRRPLGLGRNPNAEGQSGDLPHRVSHSIVELQGVAYQAAQYIGKMMAAESFATFGVDLKSHDSDLMVSAPVAPITKTASLKHPLFDAAFAGASSFDVLISEPQATRVVSALLALHDLLCPDAPSRATNLPPQQRVAKILGEQIHGGVYAQPYAFGRTVMASAAVGLTREPKLIGPAARFLTGRR